MLKLLAPVAALLLSVAILLLGNGLQGTLLPVRAQLEDFSSVEIGILGSSYFLGFALGCVLAPYAIRRVGHIRVFAALASLPGKVDDVEHLAGLGRSRPLLAASIGVFMFSLSGIPPLAGFWGKLALFTSAL